MSTERTEDKFAYLRHQAETRLKKRSEVENLSPEEMQQLIYELQVYQIELEIQNEELRHTQLELEASRRRYADLYNFAPIGYFLINKNRIILEVNLTGISMLKKERNYLIDFSFSRFVASEDKHIYYYHINQVFSDPAPKRCEVRLIKSDGSLLYTQLDSVAVLDKHQKIIYARIAVSEITKLKEAEAISQRYTKRLQALRAIDRAILSVQSPVEVASAALAHLRELILCFQVTVVTFNPEIRDFEVLASIGDTSHRNRDVLYLENHLIEKLKQGQYHLVQDLQHIVSLSSLEEQFYQANIRAYATIPLLAGGELVGYLNLNHDQPNSFTAEDVEIAREVADSLAVALLQAQLYEQNRQDAATKTILLKEANHRVKNNLMVISGLLRIEQRYTPIADRVCVSMITERLAQRVQMLAEVHTILSQSEWSPLSLPDFTYQIIHIVLELLSPGYHVQVTIIPSNIHVSPRQARSLALVINELVINSIEHAFLASTKRTTTCISVNFRQEEDIIHLEYQDDGPGYPEKILGLNHQSVPTESSFKKRCSNVGLYLIQSIVTGTLRGKLSLANDGGAITKIQFKTEDIRMT